ncbi:MAG: twin-arginine translocase TatA/TatE family subunit [Candidatus Acetothermia bacterium]|jgi:sec-independent protein translocase protein TatA|nr:twin-arginine translocase TatA/TatE family subunit [Candidatus Acetothermia bacterium]MDH7505920.1 twin-arginine translocase TatA/TatE family subunit [Candidatus Acetothermia bacterium]
MGNIGPMELILILAIVLLIFGANKLPEIARSLGKGVRAFRDEAHKIRRDLEQEEKIEEIKDVEELKDVEPQPNVLRKK